MLRPADCVTNRRRFVRARCPNKFVGDLVKQRRWNTADFLHHLRSVAREMAFQFLEDALRISQSEIPLRKAEVFAFIEPALHRVIAFAFVPAGEKAIRFVFRVLIIVAQDAGSICIVDDVLTEEQLVLDDVSDESAKERDIAAGTDWDPDIGQRAGARETWIDMNDRGALLLRFHDPAKTDRVRFGHRRTFDQNAICLRQILLRGCSSAPAEGGAQTGHRAAVSYPRLVGYAHQSQAESEQFLDEVIFFVIEGGAAEMTNSGCVID